MYQLAKQETRDIGSLVLGTRVAYTYRNSEHGVRTLPGKYRKDGMQMIDGLA